VQTNLPNGQAATGNGGARSKSSRAERTQNNEIGETTRVQVHETGVVRRVSVAALIDGTYTPAADGNRTYQPRSPEELQQLASLVRADIGYNEARGDSVQLVNLRFAGVEEALPQPPINILGFERADILKIGEMLVLAVVAVLFILLVVRPLLLRVLENNAAAAAEANNLLAGQTGATPALPAPAGLTPALPAGTPGGLVPTSAAQQPPAEAMIDIGQVEGRVAASSIRKIGEIVEKHPEEAVAIVRSWMYQGA